MAIEYKVKRVITPVMEFVKTCPFLDEFNIDMTPASTQKLITSKPPGTALDYVGSVPLSRLEDIIGNTEVDRQANFELWLLRKSSHEIYRQEIADFLYNFEQWVEFCQAYQLTPKISEVPQFEVMWADNGVYFAEWDGEQTSLYVVQLHVRYKNEYKEDF